MREFGASYLALEDRQLVAEHEELDILRPLRPGPEDDELEEAAKRPIKEGESHAADPPSMR